MVPLSFLYTCDQAQTNSWTVNTIVFVEIVEILTNAM